MWLGGKAIVRYRYETRWKAVAKVMNRDSDLNQEAMMTSQRDDYVASKEMCMQLRKGYR